MSRLGWRRTWSAGVLASTLGAGCTTRDLSECSDDNECSVGQTCVRTRCEPSADTDVGDAESDAAVDADVSGDVGPDVPEDARVEVDGEDDSLNDIGREAVCGNGRVEAGEFCDDGNTVDELPTDCEYGRTCEFCTAQCSGALVFAPGCGDGVVQEGFESCDDELENRSAADALECAYGEICSFCIDCEERVILEPRCGDGILNADAEPAEICDDGNNVDEDRLDCPYDELCDNCTSDCGGLANGTSIGRFCGDGFLDVEEECETIASDDVDDYDIFPDGDSCIARGYAGGELSCGTCVVSTASCE